MDSSNLQSPAHTAPADEWVDVPLTSDTSPVQPGQQAAADEWVDVPVSAAKDEWVEVDPRSTDEQEESDFTNAIRTGLKQALLPFSVEQKEQRDIDTKGEAVANTGADIAASIATAAAAAKGGAAVGSLLGPVGAGVGAVVAPLIY